MTLKVIKESTESLEDKITVLFLKAEPKYKAIKKGEKKDMESKYKSPNSQLIVDTERESKEVQGSGQYQRNTTREFSSTEGHTSLTERVH